MSESVTILGGHQSDFSVNLDRAGGSVESLVKETVLATVADAQIERIDDTFDGVHCSGRHRDVVCVDSVAFEQFACRIFEMRFDELAAVAGLWMTRSEGERLT